MTTREEKKAIKSFIADCMKYMKVATCAECTALYGTGEECDIESITTIEQAREFCSYCDGRDCDSCELYEYTSKLKGQHQERWN